MGTNLIPLRDHAILHLMRIISRKQLREFWAKHKNSEKALKAWFADTKAATWANSMDIKREYRNASFISDNRVVFNIKGNKYRLITAINYEYSIVYIRFIGTHKEYDRIAANTI